MIRVVTGSAMRAADAWTISHGKPLAELMESAGRAVAERAKAMMEREGRWPGRVLVVCGKGHNGGDGRVAARLLAGWGARVEVAEPGDAGAATLESLRETAERADLVVDALLGTGARGFPRPAFERAIRAVNEAGRPVLAVDVPSGLNADTGRADGAAIRADRTLCLGAIKLGCLTGPDHHLSGVVEWADIGIPSAAYEARDALAATPFHPIHAPEPEDLRGLLPVRPPGGHKGTFGRVLVLGGSTGLAGAAALSARAALRAGAGLVTVFTPKPVWPIVASLVPEATVFPGASDGDGRFSEEAWERLVRFLGATDAIVCGPGLGRGPGVARIVSRLLASAWSGPLVLDADGLVQADAGALRDRARAGRVTAITPHAGELGHLLGAEPKELEADRLAALRRAVDATGAIVVYKGSGTLTGSPDGRAWVNGTGGSALATGGTGDVLAGLLGGLWGQPAAGGSCSPGLAAALAAAAVWIHGRAGDLAGATLGARSVTAGDVCATLPAAFREVEG